MASPSSLSLLSLVLIIFNLLPLTLSQSIIQIPTTREARSNDVNLYCDSWRLSVETNNAGYWANIPSKCQSYVKQYMTSDHYLSDSEIVAYDSLSFAKTVNITGDGKDTWVFDIDETLLSNVPYYEAHGFGSQRFHENYFDQWVDLPEAPALPASLYLYNELKHLGFTIVLLTGRTEDLRKVTTRNLLLEGYSDWERLFLRGIGDQNTTATVYKSQKRMELINEGYRIYGNSGDQWSDLLGFAVAKRSFKLPNPMYYIQ